MPTARTLASLPACAGACLGSDYPAWSPDGKSVAFTYYNAKPAPTAGPPSGDSIRVIDVVAQGNGRDPVAVPAAGGSCSMVTGWDTAGHSARPVFVGWRRDRLRIEVVRVRDGQVRPVTSFRTFAFHPDWAANANLIAFDTYDLLAYGESAPCGRVEPVHGSPRRHAPEAAHALQDRWQPPLRGNLHPRRQTHHVHLPGRAKPSCRKHPKHRRHLKAVATHYGGPVTHPRLSPAR